MTPSPRDLHDSHGTPGPSSFATDDPAASDPVVVIGGGPAGLTAAETLVRAGLPVQVYDAMPSVGRKFLLAGKGGLNLTHSEARPAFDQRFGAQHVRVGAWLDGLDGEALRRWAAELGVETFVGTSGRVFPTEMKAAPLLRAWLHRLRSQGVRFFSRHRWVGWQAGDPPTLARFQNAAGVSVHVRARAVVLALGGGSWPQLGSDGAWVPLLAQRQVSVEPLRPANCGFDVGWSPFFAERFAGAPMKSVALRLDAQTPDGGAAEAVFRRQGEFVITATGVEGSLIYAVAALVRDRIAQQGSATVALDLVPARSEVELARSLASGRGKRSLSNHLKAHAGIDGVKAALLRETCSQAELSAALAQSPAELAQRLKSWPLTLRAPRPLAEAISTAGGVGWDALTPSLMLKAVPGVFCAGEMLDWEAPTGGYLLTASMASGRAAGAGVLAYLASLAAPVVS